MTPLEEYFDAIVLINLARRTDRLEESIGELSKLGIRRFTLFEGHDMPGWGNNGCTASHRGVIELASHHKWQKTLVLEDDFKVLHEDCQERFSFMIHDVPKDWFLLYLGGHYAEPPIRRISPCVIQCGQMKTTSSYAFTYDAAREMAPHVYGIGPIDNIMSGYCIQKPCYIFQPRLMAQRESYSDIQRAVLNNEGCMTDPNHENMV